MSEIRASRPAITVASIVEREGRYLLIEEHTRNGIKLNQPAGHLEPNETLMAAATRETLEETGWHVTPTGLIGIYRWDSADTGTTFVRFSFAAEARLHETARVLDNGIVRAVWMTYADIAACTLDHRSPLVMRCIEDFRSGRRWPLDLMTEIE